MPRLSGFIGVGALLLTDVASAEELGQSVKETCLLVGLEVDAGPSVTGVGGSMLGTHRLHWLEAGIELRYIGPAPLPFALSAGGVAGLHLGRRLSLRILGAFGGRYYALVGHGLLSADPGVSGSTAYVGARYSWAGHSRGPGIRNTAAISVSWGAETTISIALLGQ